MVAGCRLIVWLKHRRHGNATWGGHVIFKNGRNNPLIQMEGRRHRFKQEGAAPPGLAGMDAKRRLTASQTQLVVPGLTTHDRHGRRAPGGMSRNTNGHNPRLQQFVYHNKYNLARLSGRTLHSMCPLECRPRRSQTSNPGSVLKSRHPPGQHGMGTPTFCANLCITACPAPSCLPAHLCVAARTTNKRRVISDQEHCLSQNAAQTFDTKHRPFLGHAYEASSGKWNAHKIDKGASGERR